MIVAVSPCAAQSPHGVTGGERDCKRRQPGRQPVREIINARGGASEVQVTFVFVAPAGVERVETAQEDGSRRRSGDAPERIAGGAPEARACYGVDEIFSETFDSAAHGFRFAQSFRFAADDHRKCAVRGFRVAVF